MMKQFAGHLTIILLAAAGAIMLTACQKNDVTDFEVISVYQYGVSC